ncbi:hypothetical protein H5410_064887, partial [Solanum commersonii]
MHGATQIRYAKKGSHRKDGTETLKHAFPVLHSLSQGQEATVAELWTGQRWNLFLRRGLNDWEMTTIARFHDTMQMATNLTGEEDRLRTSGLEEAACRMATEDDLENKIPYKVETVNHLFLHCKWTDQLWQMFIQKRKIKWTKPGSIIEVLQCWNRDGNAGKNEKRWRIVPACIWWTIWKERNQRCFEGKQNNIQKIKANCLGLYYFWCKQVVIEDVENIFIIVPFMHFKTNLLFVSSGRLGISSVFDSSSYFSCDVQEAFPLYLTQLMAEERGLVVDVDGFNVAMDAARKDQEMLRA